MHRPAVLIGVMMIGAGVTVCAPEIRAFRRLADIARTLRQDAATGPTKKPDSHADRESL